MWRGRTQDKLYPYRDALRWVGRGGRAEGALWSRGWGARARAARRIAWRPSCRGAAAVDAQPRHALRSCPCWSMPCAPSRTAGVASFSAPRSCGRRGGATKRSCCRFCRRRWRCRTPATTGERVLAGAWRAAWRAGTAAARLACQGSAHCGLRSEGNQAPACRGHGQAVIPPNSTTTAPQLQRLPGERRLRLQPQAEAGGPSSAGAAGPAAQAGGSPSRRRPAQPCTPAAPSTGQGLPPLSSPPPPLQACGSVLVAPTFRFHEWWSRALVPGQHYVRVTHEEDHICEQARRWLVGT